MILVESSTIQGFEQKEENLIVEFKNGRKYEYEKVPKELVEAFEKSESKGKFLNQNIKNKFECKRLH